MREILFKAKRIDNGEWVEGNFVQTIVASYIVIPYKYGTILGEGKFIEVDPSTICQYTGLNDKNGKKIWENDICRYYNPEDKDGIGIIKDDYVSWVSGTLSQKTMTPLFYLKCGQEWEVYGNIFDNPELLK